MCKVHFDLSDEQLYGDQKEVVDKRFLKEKMIPKFAGEQSMGASVGIECGTIREPMCEYWTSREIMQELGSFYRRINYNFWVESLGKTMEKRGVEDVIITDVRHINECEFVKKKQGVLIKIIRPDADEIHGMTHESEIALDDRPEGYFDIEINNSGTLEDLHGVAEDTSDAIITLENITKKGRIEVNG